MAKIRFGVVGCGGMGMSHLEYLAELSGAKIAAACDVVPERATAAAEKYACKPFTDHRDMLASGLVDAIIIATPHYDHPPIAIDAFKRGIHVISEKPLGVTLTPVDEMIRAAKESGCQFAVVYQMRTAGIYQKARELVQSGRLGDIIRVIFISPGYRSQAYYESDAWRGTWADEGGGVIVNQAPHYSDMLWFLAGLPCEVTGRIATKLHNIEVEDEAEAFLKYPNGATGYYTVSTAEAPGCEFIRIVGDKSTLIISDGKLRLGVLDTPLRKFTRESTSKWGAPKATWTEIEVPARKEVGHKAITANFIRAINNPKVRLIAPGAEGINQVEISCAIFLSHFKQKPVAIPVDRGEYDRLMAKLIRTSRRLTGTRKVKDRGVKFFT